MPRHLSAVKKKQTKTLQTPGPVDLHFHGAFGIDLMNASAQDLNKLSLLLWKRGVAGFCPTTLSTDWDSLLEAVRKLGQWIRSGSFNGAIPLGIHLEGPFIHPGCCGAHPRKSLRPYRFLDLIQLWEISQKTLKILTLAPELLTPAQLEQLGTWAKKNKITLSMGHSQATESQALLAIQSGFSSVTHAWNALKFHHRNPGVLGASLGHQDIFLELIIDGQHVHPALIQWTRQIHSPHKICFISDCTPAGATQAESIHRFGPLNVSLSRGASRTPNGALAGGGSVLTETYIQWIQNEAQRTRQPIEKLLKSTLRNITTAPLAALGISSKVLQKRQVAWNYTYSSKGSRVYLTQKHIPFS